MTVEIFVQNYSQGNSQVIPLDMPDETVWSWECFLASNGLRDAWSTDVEIPKTVPNMKALGIVGMLEGYQSKTIPGVLHIASRSIDVDVVVGTINESTVTVTLYERTIPADLSGKSIKEFLKDDFGTMFQWNKYSNQEEPDIFQRYVYGMAQNLEAAMWHPCWQLNHIIANVNQQAGTNLPYAPWDYYALSTGKKVCPQNARQTIEIYRDGDELKMRGSQHVINDLSWNGDTVVLFNRGCRAHITAITSFDKKTATTNNFHWMLSYDFNNDVTNTPTQARIVTIPSAQWSNGVVSETWDWNLSYPGEMRISMVSEGSGNPLDKYNLMEVLLIIDYLNYDDSDEDTDELEYIPRRPGLHVATSNLIERTYYVNGQIEHYDGSQFPEDDLDYRYKFVEWNGDRIGYFHYRTGHPNTHYMDEFTTTKETFAWFGLYWNLPDISIRDLMYAVAFSQGKKLMWENGDLVLKDLEHQDISGRGEILEITPNSELGRETFIKLEGGRIPILEEDNDRLEAEKSWYDCPLTYVYYVNAIMGKINQYSDLEVDDEGETEGGYSVPKYSCKFEDVDGFCIMTSNDTHHFLGRIKSFYTLAGELQWLTSMKPISVKIRQLVETYPDRLDLLTLDGHDFLVLNGEITEETVEYECLLMDQSRSNDVVVINNPDPYDDDDPDYPDDHDPD